MELELRDQSVPRRPVESWYDEEYYRDRFGPTPYARNSVWLNFFGDVADHVIRCLRPKKVFDAGCAWGFLVEAFRDRGVEAYGRDISTYAIGQVRQDLVAYCGVGSLTQPILGGPYDLVACIEVLEHMEESAARQAAERIAQVTDCILFSSTPDDFAEPTHINVHPTDYWLTLFAGLKFYPDLVLDASFVAPHSFVLRRGNTAPGEDVLVLLAETVRLRQQRASFQARQSQVEQLGADVATLKQRLEDATRDLNRRFAKREQQSRHLQSLLAERQRSRQAHVEPASANGEFEISRMSSADIEDAIRDLSEENEALKDRLASIFNSPGWRFVQRYRDWLESNRWRRPWVREYFEPVTVRLLRLANLQTAPPGLSNQEQANKEAASPSGSTTQPQPVAGGKDEADAYQTWIRENEPDATLLDIQRQLSRTLTYRPIISVLVPVYRVPLEVLTETVDSVCGQTYDNWELCITVTRSDSVHAISYLETIAGRDPRVRVKCLESNEGISGNSNQALTLATGEYLALLDHDDTLAPFALFEVVQLLNQDRRANFIYSDRDNITEDGRTRFRPLFKPQWSPEVMLNANYLTHLCVMRTEDVREIGGWRGATDGAQDWDLFLRIIQRFGNVRHIPKVLYHWRRLKTSVASGMNAKPYAAERQVLAVQDYCDSMKIAARVTGSTHINPHLQWASLPEPRVSVIYISKKPAAEMRTLSEALRIQTEHPPFEIVVAGLEATPSAVSAQDRIERAVASASGDILVFIDEAISPTDRHWLDELTGPLQVAEVGLVGARILDADTRTLRHCGIVFTKDGRLEYPYAWHPESCCEQAGGTTWYRNWTAVSGACFAMRRDLWNEVNGLSGEILYPRLDVQLCLKIQLQTSRRILYNPYARLVQKEEAFFETPLPGDGRRPSDRIRECLPDGDPYFSPNLDCRNGKVGFDRRPKKVPPGSDYAADSRVLVGSYDFSPELVRRCARLDSTPSGGDRLDSITWFLPNFGNAFFGGLHTILRFADTFQQKHKVRSNFCILGSVPPSRVREKIGAAFPQLADASRIVALDRPSRVNELPPTDAAVCSFWTTAYAALEFEGTKQKFYFMQDDEALFYPAGSTSALVEASYGFGFYGLCNTVSLLERYVARGGQGESFNPCVDVTVFHDRNRKAIGAKGPFLLFCYGRPDHPRNCFEILAAALRILKKRMAANVTIVMAGAEWDPRTYELEGVVENLGILNYRTTGALYRACDAGVVMMMTRHPSYLPLELMACGSLVVANRNADTEWLLKDGENCLLADPSATSLAARIEEGLRDTDLRHRVTMRASEIVRAEYSRWEEPIERIYRYMSQKI